jgi:hypothetical protein
MTSRWPDDIARRARGEYAWSFDKLRRDPDGSLSRPQLRMLVQAMAANQDALPSGISEPALDDVSQYILRLWFAINGERSLIEGVRPVEEELIVSAYGHLDQVQGRDRPFTQEQRHEELRALRADLDSLITTVL